MPNSQQHDTLNQMFSVPEGDYFEVIKNYNSVLLNIGTKILYLERAITLEDHTTFLNLLDKLYQSLSDHANQAENVELIRTFKLINDFYFNKDINYTVGYYNQNNNLMTKRALDHWFGSLQAKGEEINVAEFQLSIKKLVDNMINKLSEGYSEEVINAQKQAREAAEEEIIGKKDWLNIVNPLPSNECRVAISASAIRNFLVLINMDDDTDDNRLNTDPDTSQAESNQAPQTPPLFGIVSFAFFARNENATDAEQNQQQNLTRQFQH